MSPAPPRVGVTTVIARIMPVIDGIGGGDAFGAVIFCAISAEVECVNALERVMGTVVSVVVLKVVKATPFWESGRVEM